MIESHVAAVVPLSLALDEQHLPRDTLLEHVQPNTQPKTMAFYVLALLLNKILHDILSAFCKSSGTVNTDAYETERPFDRPGRALDVSACPSDTVQM
jgi:hypothetical protein